jgi:hypothetical protein
MAAKRASIWASPTRGARSEGRNAALLSRAVSGPVARLGAIVGDGVVGLVAAVRPIGRAIPGGDSADRHIRQEPVLGPSVPQFWSAAPQAQLSLMRFQDRSMPGVCPTRLLPLRGHSAESPPQWNEISAPQGPNGPVAAHCGLPARSWHMGTENGG